MLGVSTMHTLGYAGQGRLIAVFDAGFPGVNTVPCFDSLNQRNGIVATYDFVSNNSFVYAFHPHGTNVLGTLAGYLPGSLIGPAYGAQFILCRTEDAPTEFRVEETNWLFAAEFADSIGVDIINTSLGYYTFDNPAMDYTPADMDGNTTWITRAADLAASKGILCVASAGNNGSDPAWRVITAPADGDSVLAVGAVSPDSIRVGFSSVGLSATGRIKPDVTAQGDQTIVAMSNGFVAPSSGTSFSGPLVAGLAAGFWQANPSLTAHQVLTHLRNSGHKANSPDSLVGYGIPNFSRAMALAGNPIAAPQEPERLVLKGNLIRPTDELRFDLIGVNTGEQVTIQVVDMTGRMVLKQRTAYNGTTQVIQVGEAALADGHYILLVETSRIRGKARFAVR
jgi:subtilisin family serine protease